MTVTPQLQIVLPVHNEGASIERTLREWHEELSSRIDVEFIVAEDGSKDDTKDTLRRLSGELPLRLDMTDERRGYAGAVVAALKATSSPYVLAVDSDGQCDPKDFWRLWDRRNQVDVVMGWRVRRSDPPARRIMSRAFGLLHRLLFGPTLHDPSCPYLIIRRHVLNGLLPKLGTMTEGFWWEFVARASLAGFSLGEVPIHHRIRTAGSTVVFIPRRLPRIAWQNGLGLLRIRMGRS